LNGFIVNPRKSLRLPVRCTAWLDVGLAGGWSTSTEDVGAQGCRVVAPEKLRRDARVQLDLTCPRSTARLAVHGRVAWVASDRPWRVGVDYAPPDRPAAARWFDEVLAQHRELLASAEDRVPDRIAFRTLLYVGRLPEGAVHFDDEEAAVLQLVSARPTVADFQRAMAVDWTRAQRALFSLLARGLVTLDRAKAGDPLAWRALLKGLAHGNGRPSA
jgi:hypothetical protein